MIKKHIPKLEKSNNLIMNASDLVKTRDFPPVFLLMQYWRKVLNVEDENKGVIAL